MERKVWTARGVMTDADKPVIAAIAGKSKPAARIFVTGEAAEGYLGDEAVRLLVNINDVYYENNAASEPLFVETRKDTVRMTRFDPAFVWRCFYPGLLAELIEEEAARLGVGMNPHDMEHFDFYEQMVADLRPKEGFIVPVVKDRKSLDEFYNAVYLSCLLLFGKPNYMDIPAAEHFAMPGVAEFMRSAEYRELNRIERKEAE